MNINLTVRKNNPVFWFNIILAIVGPVMAYFGLTGADFTTWPLVWDTIVKAVSNPYVIVTVIISVWNAINDPTTAGITDSARAMTYTTPCKDK